MQYKCNYTLFQFNLNQMRYLSEDSRIVGCCPSQFHRRANLIPHTAQRATEEKKKIKFLTNSKNCCFFIPIFVCHDFPQDLSSVFPFSFLYSVHLRASHKMLPFLRFAFVPLNIFTSAPKKIKEAGGTFRILNFRVPICQFSKTGISFCWLKLS